MKVDIIIQVFSTFINTLLFGYILFIKSTTHNFNSIILIIFACLIYFIIFYKLIRGKKKRFKTSNTKITIKTDSPKNINHQLIQLINSSNENDDVKKYIKSQISRNMDLYNNDRFKDNLLDQYKICIENEKFYEQIAWHIGSIFIPVSLTLGTVGLIKNLNSPKIIIVAGFLIFVIWLLLFKRFRTSIRLFRDCSMFIEKLLGLFTITYVYEYNFEKYGYVIRVWSYLMTICGFYFNYLIYSFL